jgi:hypothetical protein
MSLLFAGALLGGLFGLMTGGSIKKMAACRLRGEAILLLTLIAQSVLPVFFDLPTIGAQAAVFVYALWVTCVLVVAGITAINLRSEGMPLVLVGLMANLTVILANTGMPVLARNLELTSAGATAIETGLSDSWLHVAADASTRFLFLSDVIPVHMPVGQSFMLSLGDVLLVTGLAGYLFAAAHGNADRGTVHSVLR